ncbi:hypothetical protein SDC9_41787 [bioreactor metagenome]|uniref:Uncharacterized protein n=1 Tax=bioreactor metagenome TaxID=1076179 RepID=A0A644VVY5_9ZZZZ
MRNDPEVSVAICARASSPETLMEDSPLSGNLSQRYCQKWYPLIQGVPRRIAGRIITGEKSIEEVGEEAFAAVLALLSGRQTRNETLGYHSSIDIYTMGPVI